MAQGEALPIDIRVLANLAERCHAYAKALHYKVWHSPYLWSEYCCTAVQQDHDADMLKSFVPGRGCEAHSRYPTLQSIIISPGK